MTNYKILLIDDDLEMCELLGEYLQTEGYQLEMRHDGEAGLNLAKSQNFDLILLDVMLPKMDGFEVLKQARQANVTTPILMLTARGDDFDRIFGLELGADDYLPKPFNHRELAARIKAIFRRIELMTQTSSQSVITLNDVTLDAATREVSCSNSEIILTGTEFQLLQELMRNPGEIISKEQLSKNVLGRRLAPYDRSIDMHVSNIRKKLHAASDENKIKTVRSAGYVFLAGNGK